MVRTRTIVGGMFLALALSRTGSAGGGDGTNGDGTTNGGGGNGNMAEHTLEFRLEPEGVTDFGEREYAARVSGTVGPEGSVEMWDTAIGSEVRGRMMTPGSVDRYTFSGEITEFVAPRGVSVWVDGTRVD